MLAWGTKIFVAPGEHGFSFFQVKMFTGSVSVLLTSASLKITLLKLEEATRETEHRSAVHSAPSTEVQYTLLVQQNSDFTNARALVVQWLERPIQYSEGREFDSRPGHENFRCPGRAWFLLLPSENVHWKCKCAAHQYTIKNYRIWRPVNYNES